MAFRHVLLFKCTQNFIFHKITNSQSRFVFEWDANGIYGGGLEIITEESLRWFREEGLRWGRKAWDREEGLRWGRRAWDEEGGLEMREEGLRWGRRAWDREEGFLRWGRRSWYYIFHWPFCSVPALSCSCASCRSPTGTASPTTSPPFSCTRTRV